MYMKVTLDLSDPFKIEAVNTYMRMVSKLWDTRYAFYCDLLFDLEQMFKMEPNDVLYVAVRPVGTTHFVDMDSIARAVSDASRVRWFVMNSVTHVITVRYVEGTRWEFREEVMSRFVERNELK